MGKGRLIVPECISRIAISFSGGETSAYMTKKLLDKYRNSNIDIRVVFANTGQENEETLEFVRDCDRHFGFNTEWIEAVVNPQNKKGVSAKLVNFESASRNGEPFEAMIAKYGIPNTSFPHCSRVLKKQAIRAHLRSWWQYWTAIGIRADEFDRMSPEMDKEKIFYPLVEQDIVKSDINRFWAEQDFRLNLKGYQGNCKWCWKKSLRKLMTIAAENPSAFDFPKMMEERYSNFRPASQPNRPIPALFFRGNRTVSDIFALTVAEPDFTRADDDSLVTVFDSKKFNSIDESAGCESSCEAF